MSFSRRTTAMTIFFAIAFGIPWGTWLALRMESAGFTHGTPFVFMVGATFCRVAGVLATTLESGSSSGKDLARRCVLCRLPVCWWLWLCALLLAPGVHVVAPVIDCAVHGQIGPVRAMELFRPWWLLDRFAFGLFQGPLAEELGWRRFLLPRLLRNDSPLLASVILGVVRAAWPINMFSWPLSLFALFTASAVALSILMTVLFLHTRGSVLLARVIDGSVLPGKEIARISFPTAPEPPDWLRAIVAIRAAVIVVGVTGKRLTLRPSSRMDAQSLLQS